MEKRLNKCCICGREYEGHGNNPYPVASPDLMCCNGCNYRVVIPARMEQQKKHEAMTTELEKIKTYIERQTETMDTNCKVELLHDLAWWAAEQAGELDFGSPDSGDYED